MGDDSRSIVKSLKNEINMFLESFQSDDERELTPEEQEMELVEGMDSDEVHEAIKALSQERRALNIKLESLQKELDLNTAKLEGMKLAKADYFFVEKRIQDLSDEGASLVQQLDQLDKELRNYRVRDDELQAEFLESI